MMCDIKPLEWIEKEAYSPKPGIMEKQAQMIVLSSFGKTPVQENKRLNLNENWEMVEGGNADRVYEEKWEGSLAATVPGSIHTALIEVGIIPDPSVGKNDMLAREKSFNTWWMKKTFIRPNGYENARLCFEGICESCTVWLNSRLLGSHKGMFGGPEFDVTNILKDENTLIVKINPAPYIERKANGPLNDFFNNMNIGWTDTAVFNCVYGWHYANVPSLGIWNNVKLESIPEIEIEKPFIATKDITIGTVKLQTGLKGPEGGYKGTLTIVVEPENFKGGSYYKSIEIESKTIEKKLCFEFKIPEFKLWWPNDLGEQNLYKLTIEFMYENKVIDLKETLFGIRTIEMIPSTEGTKQDIYNWTFSINGVPSFVKGANWCTIDYLMDFSKERYDRFLTLAKNQHIQILRAWGGGMPETDEFYHLCDEKGILVIQEWPTAWDSQKVQSPDVLRDTVIRNTKRLRNHPSLALWTGGNESAAPTDAVMDMIGRLTYELDGTRVFHRNDPWGGSSHNYEVYWGRGDFDFNLSYQDPFIGEFGFASSPNIESAKKYLTHTDQAIWPPVKGGGVEYHTPVFNKKNDLNILNHYVDNFLPNSSLENFILATQLSQVVTLRHTLELARTRWPDATGICYYKLTDVFPSISWSTIDYYGVPKMAYYFVQDSYQPLHACALFTKLNPVGEAVNLPIFLLDDGDTIGSNDWKVFVHAYNNQLDEIACNEFCGTGVAGRVKELGSLQLNEEQTKSSPLFIVVEVRLDGIIVDRTFYWMNYVASQGCLFNLPRTQLSLTVKEDCLIVENVGNKPAVAVNFVCDHISDSFVTDDNFFWLNKGETREIVVNRTDVATVRAWNVNSIK